MKNKKRIMVGVIRFLTTFGMTDAREVLGERFGGAAQPPRQTSPFFSNRRRACFYRREKSPNAVRHLFPFSGKMVYKLFILHS